MFVLVGGALHDGSTDPDVSAWDGPCESERDIRGLSLRADQQIGGLTLTSITAYRKTDTGFLTDRDFTALPILSSGLDTDESQFTQEIRLARSEEHTSELQSLMRISYAVFCLKKKNKDE